MDTARSHLTPGFDISSAKHNHTCGGCKAVVMLGQVRNAAGTLKWRNFESTPVEQGPHRYYRRHFCPEKRTG